MSVNSGGYRRDDGSFPSTTCAPFCCPKTLLTNKDPSVRSPGDGSTPGHRGLSGDPSACRQDLIDGDPIHSPEPPFAPVRWSWSPPQSTPYA